MGSFLRVPIARFLWRLHTSAPCEYSQSNSLACRRAPSFRMPEDRTLPIILIGAGTGIAPFRSFWQERKVEREMTKAPSGEMGVGWGELVLYFGCRQPNLDELYKNEIEQMISEKVVTSYYPAYSRRPGHKKVTLQTSVFWFLNGMFFELLVHSFFLFES